MLPCWLSGKNPPANAGDGFDPCIGKIPWRRKWQPTPTFMPEKSHGQRNLQVIAYGVAKKKKKKKGHDLVPK